MNKPNKKYLKYFDNLYSTLEILRSQNGSEWAKKQTSESLVPYFIEEVYEVIESIDNKDWKNLSEELGDVLLHIIFQCQIFNEKNIFGIEKVLIDIENKLKQRNPKLFFKKDNSTVETSDLSWENHKFIEKNRESRIDGLPKNLPSLLKAQRLQDKASNVGLDWEEIKDVWDKVEEELNELKVAINDKNKLNIREELGDILFSVTNLSRHLNISAEFALKLSNEKFINRFKTIEKNLKKDGLSFQDLDSESINKYWEKAK